MSSGSGSSSSLPLWSRPSPSNTPPISARSSPSNQVPIVFSSRSNTPNSDSSRRPSLSGPSLSRPPSAHNLGTSRTLSPRLNAIDLPSHLEPFFGAGDAMEILSSTPPVPLFQPPARLTRREQHIQSEQRRTFLSMKFRRDLSSSPGRELINQGFQGLRTRVPGVTDDQPRASILQKSSCFSTPESAALTIVLAAEHIDILRRENELLRQNVGVRKSYDPILPSTSAPPLAMSASLSRGPSPQVPVSPPTSPDSYRHSSAPSPTFQLPLSHPPTPFFLDVPSSRTGLNNSFNPLRPPTRSRSNSSSYRQVELPQSNLDSILHSLSPYDDPLLSRQSVPSRSASAGSLSQAYYQPSPFTSSLTDPDFDMDPLAINDPLSPDWPQNRSASFSSPPSRRPTSGGLSHTGYSGSTMSSNAAQAPSSPFRGSTSPNRYTLGQGLPDLNDFSYDLYGPYTSQGPNPYGRR